MKLGSELFRHRDGHLVASNRRFMSISWFLKKLRDGGGEVVRSWLACSPPAAAAYCSCCLLFTGAYGCSSMLTQPAGFIKWKKPETMIAHESSAVEGTSLHGRNSREIFRGTPPSMLTCRLHFSESTEVENALVCPGRASGQERLWIGVDSIQDLGD